MGTKILAVIPARGGSKRLPRKNILQLHGRPLIDYTITAAKDSRLITDVVFSTDDREILEVAKSLGAYAPFLRPLEISGDEIRNSSTMIHALKYMESERKIEYDNVVLLQPTSPLRSARHIDEAIEIFLESDADTLAAVRGPYKKRDINLKKICAGKLLSLINENQEYYIYNASIYIVSRQWLLLKERFTSENEVPYVMDDISSIDIDEELDLVLAKAVIEYKEAKDEKV